MIDLEQTELPKYLIVDGEEIPIETSFRAWLRFSRIARDYEIADPAILKPEARSSAPRGWVEAAKEFLASPVPTPHGSSSDERLFDWLQDSDYLVGAFQQAYGIDLTSEDMHWHRFLALYRSLPSQTKLSQIVGYRAWDAKDMKKKAEETYKELKQAWKLPLTGKEADEMLALQEELLGGEW